MKINDTYEGSLVPKRTKWIYAPVATFRDACYCLVSLFLVTFIQYSGVLTKGIKENVTSQFLAMFGVITALVIGYRIFDALNDPFMGVLIEKVHFKSGKYKPWIMIGGVTNTVVVWALFLGPSLIPSLHGWAYVLWFAVFYLLWGLTFTMNDIAYWGMLPSLTSDEKQRASITTIMTIFCSVGQFTVAGLSPILSSKFGYSVYPVIAIICGSLLAFSQLFVFFFLKEHKRDTEEEQKHPQPKFRDMFHVVKENDQVRVMVVILFTYYLGSGILNALGLNYFYFSVNFSVGSSIMTIFTVVYGLGTIISQFMFPLLSKKYNRSQLVRFCAFGLVIGYLLFYFYGLPLGGGKYLSAVPFVLNASGGMSINMLYLIPLCIIGFAIFFCQGLFYLNLVLMMTNTIEYNEYKFGERKEAIIFSLRPLTTKLAASLQQGVLYLFIALASLSGVITAISGYQNEQTLGAITSLEMNTSCDAALSSLLPWQVAVFKIGVAILPMLLFIVSYLLIKKKYKIDESTYEMMVKEIEKRKIEK